MPTTLPARPDERRLTLYQTLAFFVLLGRMRLLDRRMNQLSRRTKARRSARDQARLLAGARKWLALSARISTVTGIPEPPHALEIRAIFEEPAPKETQKGQGGQVVHLRHVACNLEVDR